MHGLPLSSFEKEEDFWPGICPYSFLVCCGFSVLGKHITGRAIIMLAKPRITNPNHHAPINRGSFGPMSISINI